jgi:hypothetical protein
MAPLTRCVTAEKLGGQVFGGITAELKPFDVESILASIGSEIGDQPVLTEISCSTEDSHYHVVRYKVAADISSHVLHFQDISQAEFELSECTDHMR